MRFIDLTGRRFGRLIVTEYVGKDRWRKSLWLCLCICGKEKRTSGHHLLSGDTKSCGCSRTKHNHTKRKWQSKTYQVWRSMKQRCTNPNDSSYKNYGGRGITFCKRWLKFENFLDDMGEKPRGLSIDRINNNGNYNKRNCQWATPKQQANNRRKKKR